jgi:hypothetical protein
MLPATDDEPLFWEEIVINKDAFQAPVKGCVIRDSNLTTLWLG